MTERNAIKSIDLSPPKISKGKELFFEAIKGNIGAQSEIILNFTNDQLDLLLEKYIDAPKAKKDKFIKLLRKRAEDERQNFSNIDS